MASYVCTPKISKLKALARIIAREPERWEDVFFMLGDNAHASIKAEVAHLKEALTNLESCDLERLEELAEDFRENHVDLARALFHGVRWERTRYKGPE